MKKTIKLRDLSKEQWDSYKRNVCRCLCTDCPIKAGKCFLSTDETSWVNNKNMYSNKFLDQEIEIELPEILDEEEKRYLSAVIKPFRNRIKFIKKTDSIVKNKNYNYIRIGLKVNDCTTEYMEFPTFEENTMYKNMKLYKKYTLDELDL